MQIPNDPFILLSFVNTQLRDKFDSLEDLCHSLGIEADQLKAKLKENGFEYDERQRHFR